MIYTIKNSELEVKVNSFGAEVVSVKYNGIEKFWQNKDGKWDGHCPMLFPYCGHVTINHNNRIYPCEPHGFAKDREFELNKIENDLLVMSLKSDNTTHDYYPFDFIFTVRFSLSGNKLKFEYEVLNDSAEPLYFSCGGHESFITDSDISGYKVLFNKEETFDNLLNDDNGYLTDKTVNLGKGKELVLKEEYFDNGASLIFKGLNSDNLIFSDKVGKKICKINFKGFDVLLFWKEPYSEFICIEPWLNIPDGYENVNLPLSSKYGFVKVDPCKKQSLTQTITFYE